MAAGKSSNPGALHQLFEKQAARTPRNIAACINHEKITYAVLNRRANQLAHHLRKLHVDRDTIVCICVNRSLDMVVALLGSLKAGSAYVLLDADHLTKQSALVLADAKPALVLTRQHCLASLPAGHVVPFCLDTQWLAIARHSVGNPQNRSMPGTLACLLYLRDTDANFHKIPLTVSSLMHMVTRLVNGGSDCHNRKTKMLRALADRRIMPFREIFLTLCQQTSSH
jgi:non-ribosomal peptide synthetase component F